jgi:antirestriction protein ArdC
MTNRNPTQPDIYTRITNQIIAALETGTKPWMQPWQSPNAAGALSRPLRHNGSPYAGINVLALWSAAMLGNYNTPTWMTFKQAIELGGCVRKGEKGSPVVYANTFTKEADPETGDDDRQIPFLKAYTVFNVDQIDGLPAAFYAKAEILENSDTRHAAADSFIASTGADIRYGGAGAYYRIDQDHIQMPVFERFHDAEGFYATLAHELTHWTRHPSRLDRDFGRKRFGDEGYAQEELVAELGAAFLCADLRITNHDREDHAAYVASWLKALRNDTRAVFTASAHAERAVAYLHGLVSHAPL